MATPTPKPTSPFKKQTKTAVKATSPFLKSTKKEDPWAPVLSFGQSVIDTLSTPLYGVEGTINALLKGKNPIEAAQAGADNATAWTRGKRPITGSELLKTAGIESNFWSSLAADVLLDPLTYTPGVVFTAPLKAAGIASKAAVKAGSLAAKGEIAATKGTGKLATGFAEGFSKKPFQAIKGVGPVPNISTATDAQKAFFAKYAKKQEATKANLEKYSYNTITVPTNRKTGQAVNDVLASAFVAGKQAMVGTLLSEGAKRTLRKYAAKSARIVRKSEKDLPSSIKEVAAVEAAIQTPKTIEAVTEAIAPKTTPKATPKTVAEQIQLPVLADTAPTTQVIKDVAKAAPNTAEVSNLKKILANVEKAAKAAKVTTIAATDNVAKVKQILSIDRDRHVAFVTNMDQNVFNRIKDAVVRKDGASPFSFYRYFIESNVPDHVALAKNVGGIKLIDNEGTTYTLAQIANNIKNDKQVPAELMQQAAKMFDDNFLKLGNAKGLEDYRYAQLSQLLGKEAADAFKKTGALNPSKTTNQTALEKLIAELPQGDTVTKKTYDGFDSLIVGLKNGDIVDTDSLLKVIRALDPEAKLEAQVEKAMSKDAYNGLKDLLIRNVRSVFEVRSRIDKATPETMFKAKGTSFADTAAVYTQGRMDGTIEALPEAILRTRQAAATSLAKQLQSVINDVATAISRAFDNNFKYIESEGLKNWTVTSRGDYVARTTDGKMSDLTKAARYLETNENFATKLYGSLLGRSTSREVRKAKNAIEKGVKYRPTDRLSDLAGKVNTAEKILLATVGTRFIVKNQAKLTKKGEVSHFAFLHLGDFADTAINLGFRDVAERALFPDTANKYDGISTTGLMDAIRMTLEGVEKNAMPTHADLVKRLMSRGKGQEPLSPEFKAAMPQIADELATELSRPEVIKAFTDYHTGRLLGDIEDSLQPAITMTGEIFELLHKAWKANNDLGINSPAARMDVVRQYFNEFAFVSHIFDQSYGPAGEAVFKAAASMFVKDGRVGDARLLPTDAEEFAAFREALANYFKHTNAENVAPAGREHLPYPSPKTQAKLQNDLTETMAEYQAHMEKIPTLATKADVKEWARVRVQLQKKLDSVRPKAWGAWLQTYHWVGGDKPWVATERYNHELAVKAANENRIILTVEGPVNLGPAVNDTKVATKGPKQTKTQKDTAIKKRDDAARKKGDNEAVGAKADGAAEALNKVDEIKQQHPDDALAVAARLEQEALNDPLLKSNIPMFLTRLRWERVRNPLEGEKRVGTLQRLGEKLSATKGKEQTIQIAARNETTMMLAIQSIAHGATLIRDRYIKTLTDEQMAEGFTYALHQTPVPKNTDPVIAGLVQDLRQLFDPIQEELANTTIPNEILDAAFRHYGITKQRGFNMAKDTADKNKMLHDLPFIKIPDDIAADTDAARAWNERAQAFKDADLDPFVMLANYAGAIQMAKTEVAIGRQFAVQFSHVAEGLTHAEAIARGYVRPKGIGAGIDLTLGIPETALFHPYYAEQFGAMNRHWNGVYEKGMPDALRVILDITGIFKGTQTLLRPGHHLTNIIGDTTVAIMRGARNPGDWARALNIGLKHAGEDVRSNWGKNKLDTTFKQITRRLEGVGGRKYVPGEEEGALTVSIGGKKVSYTNEELTKMFEDNGVLINNIFYDQYQGLYEAATDVAAKNLTEEERALRKEILVNLREGVDKVSGKFQEVIKPFGDLASYYGNIPRTATALDIMKKGNFKSVEDMLMAVNDTVNRYHPTIQSLSAWERKYPRAIFTYYTWLRVAHNAMIDLALNHTSAMTFYSKAQYNKAEEAGYEPISIGQPWGEKRTTPGYINYSVYGPTYSGPRGDMLMKPAILPMDVLDNWNIIYDPAYTMDQNAARNVGQFGQGLIGKNVNILAQLPLELLTKTSPSTGKPSQVKDAQSLMDRLFSMTGFYTLAKGAGYTPPNKGAESANPLTQRDRDLLIQNWLLGLKQADVYTPTNVANAQSEQTARYNAFMKNYQGDK